MKCYDCNKDIEIETKNIIFFYGVKHLTFYKCLSCGTFRFREVIDIK